MFEATTHAGEVKADILFAMSVVARAKHVKYTIMRNRKDTYGVNAGKEINSWLARFGWTNEYFKTAKYHILKRVNAATARRGGSATANRASNMMEVLA